MIARKHIILGLLLIPVLLLILFPAVARAQVPVLKLGQPRIQEGTVTVDVELRDFLNKASLASLQSGLPATLVFQWTVRQNREGWRDLKVATGSVRNRIFFDVLEEQYHLFNHQGRPLGACDAISGIAQALCRREDMVLVGVGTLKKGAEYYVEMEVSLEILNDQQVRGFEDWLLGDGTEGTDAADLEPSEGLVAQEEGSGFSSGLSDVVLGVVLKITGIADETVQGQSPSFYGGG